MLAFSAVVPTDPMRSARPFAASLALWLGAVAAAGEETPASGLTLDWGFEARAHLRSSDENRFPVPFSFDDPRLPPVAGPIFLETASPDDHLELSAVTLFADAAWGSGVAAHVKIDLVDLYDRNPTSGDRQVDVDEAWLRFGREAAPAALPGGAGAYLKVGKLPKLERQDDRHLESYGLVSTAFNRFEDFGVELGIDLGRHVYVKATATQGNPLVWAAGSSQLFPFVQPAVRWSRLDNDFANPARTPFPSGNWDWEKLDAGVRLGIVAGVDLTLEYAANPAPPRQARPFLPREAP